MHTLTQLLIEAENIGGLGSSASIELDRYSNRAAPRVVLFWAHVSHPACGSWGKPGLYVDVNKNDDTRNVYVFTDDHDADPADLLRELIAFLRRSPIREEVVL